MTAEMIATSRTARQPLLVRTVEIDDPGALLDLVPRHEALGWVRRGDGLVGWGRAVQIRTSGRDRFAAAERGWHELLQHAVVRDEVGLPGTGPVAFGAFAFADDGEGVLIVPRVVVGRRGATSWLTTIEPAARIGPAAQIGPAATLAAVLDAPEPVLAPGAVSFTDGALSAAGWTDVVAQGVEAIRAGEVDKVVLARDLIATTERKVDPRWVLRRLAAAYESCWTFSVDGILGATPELLIRTDKGLVTSRVLAGTIRRTGDDDADLARAATLAHSSKDLEEHEYAVASVARSLEPFCSSTNVPDVPFVLHLPNVLHLASDVTGVLAGGPDHGAVPSSLALAAALHPTAAVCGTPTAAARALISRIEGMDRGRYAGPVGWIGADGDGEWGIALRSAELDRDDPHRLRLFAGCGIVAASNPADELAESEAKLEPIRSAIVTR